LCQDNHVNLAAPLPTITYRPLSFRHPLPCDWLLLLQDLLEVLAREVRVLPLRRSSYMVYKPM
ncbi:hypothetical protein KI387_037815, partial [Taxus chinensis]